MSNHQRTEVAGIYKTPAGFMVRVSKRDPLSGKPVEKTKTLAGCFDMKEALAVKEALSIELKEELSEGKESFRDISKASYEAYIKFYQKYRLDNGIARENVVKSDAYIFDKFILPHIGKVRLAQINKRVVHHFVECLRSQLDDNGVFYSQKTYKNAFSAFRASCRMAYKLGFLLEDPTHLVSPKFPLAKDPKEKRALTKQEAALFLEEAEKSGDKIFFMSACLLVLGFRCSEVKSLTWEDINFSENYISVSKSHHRGVLNRSTKNGRAFRAPMVGIVREAAERYASSVKDKAPKGLVFPSERANSFMENSYLNTIVKRLCKKAGLAVVSPHDLRRSANSILMLSAVGSVAPEVVSKVLNHKSSAMRNHYTLVDHKQAAEIIEAVWSEK